MKSRREREHEELGMMEDYLESSGVSTKSGEMLVMFDVTKMPNDVYAIVLRIHKQEYIYRARKGKVYVGAKGSKQTSGIVAELVRYAVAAIKIKEREE